MRDFESIAAFLSEREVNELQAGIDARREDRAGRPIRSPATTDRDGAAGPGTLRRGRRAS